MLVSLGFCIDLREAWREWGKFVWIFAEYGSLGGLVVISGSAEWVLKGGVERGAIEVLGVGESLRGGTKGMGGGGGGGGVRVGGERVLGGGRDLGGGIW